MLHHESIRDMLLAHLLLAVGIALFIYALYAVMHGERFDALEAAGGGLMALGGCMDPRKYVADCLSFPMSFIEPSGRDTRITVAAGYLGLLLWTIGLGGNWFWT